MSQAQLPTVVTTPRGRLSFPAVFAAKLNNLNGKMEYSAQILFEKGADLSQLKKAIENAAINKWGADKTKWPVPAAQIKLPIKSQKDLIAKAKEKGQNHAHLDPEAFYITAKTSATDKTGKPRPHPVVVGKNPKDVIEEESKFYAGCWCKLNVNASAFAKGANHGVALYLNACQFVGDAEAFSGKPNPEAAFEAIPDDEASAVGDGGAGDMFS